MDEQQKQDLEPSPIRGASPWVYASINELSEHTPAPFMQRQGDGVTWEVRGGQQSLWIVGRWPSGGGVLLRTAYSPERPFEYKVIEDTEYKAVFSADDGYASFRVMVEALEQNHAFLHFTVKMTPVGDLFMPFWPVDLYPIDVGWNSLETKGIVRAAQRGPGTGMIFLSLLEPESGSLFYLQDLTSLNEYCSLNQTEPNTRVGGSWPELGYTPPLAEREALPGGHEVIISDAYVRIDPRIPRAGYEGAAVFLDLLADIYKHLPKPEAPYRHWPERAQATVHDLSHADACSTIWEGKRYLNAYVGTNAWRPESLTLFNALMPLLDYQEWTGEPIPLIQTLLDGLPIFYDPDVKCFLRYPNKSQKQPEEGPDSRDTLETDSWYLVHGLANLARLAERGFDQARTLLMDSVEYAIALAHKFEYKWPVMFQADTMEVLRRGSDWLKAGEPDVPGLYAYLMLKLWKMTGEDKYLTEARQAADVLHGLDFALGYQFNNISWAAIGMLDLWKETKDDQYLGLAYVCLAGTFQNMCIWECDFGPAQHYNTFFGVMPMPEAPYLAAFEEAEIFEAFLEYLANAGGKAAESLEFLLAEYFRFTLSRTWCYYPCELPEEILSTEVKNGYLDRNLAIPLEDVYPGWQPPGKVGQEIYGAGASILFTIKAYHRHGGLPFLVYCDYPLSRFTVQEGQKQVDLKLHGTAAGSCRLRLIPQGTDHLPNYQVQVKQQEMQTLDGATTPEGHQEYQLPGGSEVTITWAA
ncbi:MAG: hypothetical protein ACYDCO_06570 [Armatimonadota bacterium]